LYVRQRFCTPKIKPNVPHLIACRPQREFSSDVSTVLFLWRRYVFIAGTAAINLVVSGIKGERNDFRLGAPMHAIHGRVPGKVYKAKD
jgi:hypothetical protein